MLIVLLTGLAGDFLGDQLVHFERSHKDAPLTWQSPWCGTFFVQLSSPFSHWKARVNVSHWDDSASRTWRALASSPCASSWSSISVPLIWPCYWWQSQTDAINSYPWLVSSPKFLRLISEFSSVLCECWELTSTKNACDCSLMRSSS